MKLGMQDKAKYEHCCLKGILVPKQLFVASQFAHFRQLQYAGQQQQIHPLESPTSGSHGLTSNGSTTDPRIWKIQASSEALLMAFGLAEQEVYKKKSLMGVIVSIASGNHYQIREERT